MASHAAITQYRLHFTDAKSFLVIHCRSLSPQRPVSWSKGVSSEQVRRHLQAAHVMWVFLDSFDSLISDFCFSCIQMTSDWNNQVPV